MKHLLIALGLAGLIGTAMASTPACDQIYDTGSSICTNNLAGCNANTPYPYNEKCKVKYNICMDNANKMRDTCETMAESSVQQ